MNKIVCFLIILCLCICLTPRSFSADKDCPDCPKEPAKVTLDPQWREFKPPPLLTGEMPDCHRVQFGRQDCMECHKKETPAAYAQWQGSKHGINSVKCGICHGDVNNYRARPDKIVCMGCHSQQVQNLPNMALVTNCSFCHKSHWFTVHKIKDYEKFSPGREQRFHVPGF
jgi:hypothetical protein